MRARFESLCGEGSLRQGVRNVRQVVRDNGPAVETYARAQHLPSPEDGTQQHRKLDLTPAHHYLPTTLPPATILATTDTLILSNLQPQSQEPQQQQIAANMPSKQASDVLAVEELVHEIKENLRLKARPSHNHGRNSRPSPYHIPCRSWSDQALTANSPAVDKKKSNPEDGIDDPYELLQALLKSNSLVKEAVRRLQLNISPKQRYNFYDSDEDSRSPLYRMCQLEL